MFPPDWKQKAIWFLWLLHLFVSILLGYQRQDALPHIFKPVREAMKETDCNRAILVAHNAHFDLGFLNEAIARTGVKRSPFHPFSVLDTATLCGVAYGQTVLAQAAARRRAWPGTRLVPIRRSTTPNSPPTSSARS